MATILVAAVFGALFGSGTAQAATTVFFNSSQTTNLVVSGTTSDTLSSEGYLFTLSRDKLFTGGVGLTNPIGRTIRIPWPAGLEAQAVTTGPSVSGARITVKRQDGQPFSIESFGAKLLANTAGAGGSFEIMPKLDGEDGLPDPVMYDATGYYGQPFAYNTPGLAGFDAYIMTLYVDFALTSFTVVDASVPPPILEVLQLGGAKVRLSWPAEAVGYVLESAASLPAQAWISVTNDVAVDVDRFTVELETTGTQRLYRLRK